MIRGRILPSRRELYEELVQTRLEAEAAKDSLRSAMDEVARLRSQLETEGAP